MSKVGNVRTRYPRRTPFYNEGDRLIKTIKPYKLYMYMHVRDLTHKLLNKGYNHLTGYCLI